MGLPGPSLIQQAPRYLYSPDTGDYSAGQMLKLAPQKHSTYRLINALPIFVTLFTLPYIVVNATKKHKAGLATQLHCPLE